MNHDAIDLKIANERLTEIDANPSLLISGDALEQRLKDLTMSLIVPDSNQRMVARSYQNGEYEQFSKPYLQTELEDCGDSLFIFLMDECSVEQDATTPESAIDRLNQVLADVSFVRNAFEAM